MKKYFPSYKFKQKMKLLNLLLTSFLIITLLISCTDTQEGVLVLSSKEFEAALQATPNAQLVDVRTPDEFAAGTIGTAINIDYYGDNFKAEMEKLDKNRPVFVFCAAGGRSESAGIAAEEIGFKKIYDLEAGYTAWSVYKEK